MALPKINLTLVYCFSEKLKIVIKNFAIFYKTDLVLTNILFTLLMNSGIGFLFGLRTENVPAELSKEYVTDILEIL